MGPRELGTDFAHRAAYRIFVGAIPKGKCVLHKCDTPACVNPQHLKLGTQKENLHECLAKGRNYWANKETCKRGHRYDVMRKGRGGKMNRGCLTCEREWAKNKREKRAS